MDILSSPLLIAAIAAIVVFIGYMAIDAMFSSDSQGSRLQAMQAEQESGIDGEALIEINREISGNAKFCNSIMSMLGVDVDSGLEDWKKRCMHAGMSSPDAPSFLLFYKKVVGVFVAIIGMVLIYIGLSAATGIDLGNVAIGLFLLIIGIYGADIYIKNKIQKRAQILSRSFPDTLDLLVVCVESGLALDAALAKVCAELGKAHPEITAELNQTRVELALLNDRPQALMNLAERTNLVQFRSLVAALIQTEKFGTSLTDTLRVLSEDYRLTRLMNAEQRAGRLPVMMTIPLILLLMPAFVMVILAPPIIRVSQQGGLFGGG